MDDVRDRQSNPPEFLCRRWVMYGEWLCFGVCLLGLAGCSLFVLAGKMILGDPAVPAAFEQSTGVELTEGDKKVVVLCSAPSMTEDGGRSINYEIVESVSRRMKRRGISLIDSNKVRTWMDDNGGRLDDPRDLAEDFDADFIVYISLGRVTFREENSPSLYQGVANGEVFAYEVKRKKKKGEKQSEEVETLEVFSQAFSTTYPDFHPISADQIESPRMFQKQFIDRICSQLAQMFYSHSVSEEIY